MTEDSPEARFKECFERLQNEFSTYDQTVDVVSCLELFFEEGLREEVDHFDRFPRFTDPELTPDATVIFRHGYGLVMELKRTFPKNDAGFLKEVKQVKSYDRELALRCHDGSTRTPDVMDIVLLIKSDHSAEIFKRFNRVCREEGIDFERNLIFMEYHYDASNSVEKYVIRKFPGENHEFRDEMGANGLEARLGTDSIPITVPPGRAAERNLTRVFTNDQPPEIYTVVFLWTRVLYNFLTEEQKETWRIGGPDKTLPIDLDIDRLVEFINERIIVNGRFRRPWIVKALKFLGACGLATNLPDGRVRVHYRNLRQMLGSRKYAPDGQQDFDRVRDLGGYFADLHCRRLVEAEDEPEAQREEPGAELQQKSLSEF